MKFLCVTTALAFLSVMLVFKYQAKVALPQINNLKLSAGQFYSSHIVIYVESTKEKTEITKTFPPLKG